MIDLKKFKKVASDKHSTTLRHDAGHEFKVVHSGLSPKLRKEVDRIPMAEGGDVEDPRETVDEKIIQNPPRHPDEYKMDKYDPTGMDYSQYAKRPQMLANGNEVQKPVPKPETPPTPPQPPPQDSEAKKVQDSFNKSLGFSEGGYTRPVYEEPIVSGKYPGSSSEEKKKKDEEEAERVAYPYGRPDSGKGVTDPANYADGGDVRTMVNNEVIPEQPDYGMAMQPPPSGSAQGSDYGMFGQPTQDSQQYPPASQFGAVQGANPLQQRQGPSMSSRMQNVLQQNIDQQQQIAQNYMNRKAQLDSEHAALSHDILNKHIDMSDYWKANDKGSAAIGAFLGGLGAGLTHMANPVPGMIQASQDNFLKAEMANMENPRSLLSSLQAQYGDNKDAADMLRIMSNETLTNQLNKISAPLNSANAQANAANMQMELFKNTEALKQQMAARKALQDSSGSVPGDTSPAPAAQDTSRKLALMQQTGMIDKEQYKEANKELGISEKKMQAHQAVDNIIDQSLQLQTAGSRLGSPLQSKQKLDALRAQLIPLILASSPSKRLTPESLNAVIDPFMVKFTTGKGTAEDFRQGLHDIVENNADQTSTLDGLKAYGLRTPSYEATVSVISPDGRSGTIPKSQLRQAISAGYKQAQ